MLERFKSYLRDQLFRRAAWMDARTPKVQLLVPINGTWERADSTTPSRLLDHYLDAGTSQEEVLAAAIWIHADDKPWNRPEASETFFHIEFWLSAVSNLLEGAYSKDIWAWEESSMHAVRKGDLIILEERSHHAHERLPPVCFGLVPFSRELAKESRIAVDLVSGLKQLVQDRYADDWRAALLKKENATLCPSSAPPMSQSESLSALSRLSEFERSMMANVVSSKVQPDPCAADPTALRRQIIDYLAGEGLVAAWVRLTSRAKA